MSENLLQQLQTYASQSNSNVSVARKGETFIEVAQDRLKAFITHVVNDLRILHLSTITGLDLGQNIGIVYSFSEEMDTIHVRSTVPKARSTAVSIVDIIPGAILYEMEIHDLFGVTFTGNPWMNQKLLLPDSWPADLPPPLLKTSKPAEIRKRLGLEVERK
jgi:NADH:ubiquinone oxidoreductase subunit C